MSRITIPNIITSLRIFGALILIFLPYPEIAFLIVYTLCGTSDVLDGAIARLTSTQSEWGAKLDSVADLVFYAAMLFKIIPFLFGKMNSLVWFLAAVVILVRISAYITAAIKYRRFASLHTYLNKLTGFAVFCLPYLLVITDKYTLVCSIACIVGFLASLEELILHILSKNYSVHNKTLLSNKNAIPQKTKGEF